MSREQHPIWTVYEKLRTACLNVRYYGRRLQGVERWNLSLEFVLGATAPSSAIAALWFWNTEYGQTAWKCLAIVAAIAAVAKPLLNLTSRIKEYESVLSGYRVLEYDLREIRSMIE
jgi:cytochrome c oxidase subunit IV